MKRTLLITLLSLISVVCFGQNEGALKFLGIPVDGTASQFATELKSKGFTYSTTTEGYKGQFNGKSVDVFIHTNHNLVDRVYVAFPFTNEEGIRVEFNSLLGQFEDNNKYMDLCLNKEIPADDDISYEITIKNKRYQASFSYFNPDRDLIEFSDALLDKLSSFFTEEQLAKLKVVFKKSIEDPGFKEGAVSPEQMMAEMQAMGLGQDSNVEVDSEKALLFLVALMDGMNSLADGSVWFMIHERYGRYQIGLYYDNLHNRPHGEDL